MILLLIARIQCGLRRGLPTFSQRSLRRIQASAREKRREKREHAPAQRSLNLLKRKEASLGHHEFRLRLGRWCANDLHDQEEVPSRTGLQLLSGTDWHLLHYKSGAKILLKTEKRSTESAHIWKPPHVHQTRENVGPKVHPEHLETFAKDFHAAILSRARGWPRIQYSWSLFAKSDKHRGRVEQ